MNLPEHQTWPDGTRVRFTSEAREAMLEHPGCSPLRKPSGGEGDIYTIENTDDSLHDVLLRETGERYGVLWLTAVDHNGPNLRPQRPSWQRGNWMQTYTGRQFYPLDPRPEDVDVTDIAHALSMQCRYNGHVRKFYSVAEHCVLISGLVDPEHAFWALLHDATEAYVGDMVRPLKLHMPQYRDVEDRVMLAIAERFGLDPQMPAEVKAADSRILLDERAALMGDPAGDWQVDGEPFGVRIEAWPPASAREEYLHRFAELAEKKP